MLRAFLVFIVCSAALTDAPVARAESVALEWRASSAAEQAADAEAFRDVERGIAQQMTDVQSVVVVLGGRVVFTYYRDGAESTLRDTQSVTKSALSALIGAAIGQGLIASLDQPVVALVPEWASANADPRAADITVRHLLTMTAGFDLDVARGNAAPGQPPLAWTRPLRHAPGEVFAYDNASMTILVGVIEKATGKPIADYARERLVRPMDMAEPAYRRGLLHLRTIDMARLGQLFLQDGTWAGQQLVPRGYVAAATEPQNAGGAPVNLPYGLMWWIAPSSAPRKTFFASGYAGQLVWVDPPSAMVIAITSTVSEGSQDRGQAPRLARTTLYAAARKRMSQAPR